MKKISYFPLSFLLCASVSMACVSTGSKKAAKAQVHSFFSAKKRKPANNLVRFSDGAAIVSWESKLGNLLLDHTSGQVVLSLPAVLHKSSYHPFGDGQSNAKLDFGENWKQASFPVVGIQDGLNEKSVRRYIFHPSLNISSYQESTAGGNWFKVTPKGWKDAFYFNFNTSTMAESQFISGIPEKLRTFSSKRVAPNLAQIPKGYSPSNLKNLGEGYNADAWHAGNVHGLFPDENGDKTALGGVLTWGIVDNNWGPFKTLYTCFEPRNYGPEKELGVPTGAGWHHIGDAAETIFNNLETSAIPVATGRSHSFTDAAYGLSHTLTATWLQSDQVLVNEQGTFHWYLNPYEQMVCTEIWVHPCVPSSTNNWGFNCK